MPKTRTDRHRLAVMDPSEYVAVFSFCRWLANPLMVTMGAGLPEWWRKMRERHLQLRQDPNFRDFNGGCALCGQTNYNEGVIFRHVPTGELIELGWMCADKVELAYDPRELKAIRAKRKAWTLAFRQRAENRDRLRAFVAEYADTGLLEDLRVDHHIIQDIRRRLCRWNISEKQVALVRKIAAEVRAPKEPELPGRPVPQSNKRVRVVGKLLTVKQKATDYGIQDKMLVLVEVDGGAYKLWGTAPTALHDAAKEIFGVDEYGTPRVPEGGYWKGLRGRTVAFDARVERSSRDEAFGFFSRPTKLSVT